MNNWLLILAAPLLFATAAKADESIIQTDQVRVALTTEHAAAAPGQTIWVALSFDLKSGWHTYWRTPGDAGEPVTVNWTLPAGITAGPIQWPTPERFDYSGIAGFGYLGHATLLTALKVDPSVAAPSTLSLKADATWLACSAVCVPDEGSISIPLHIETGVRKAGANPAIASALRALPRPAPWPVKAARAGDTLVVTAGPGVKLPTLKSVRYFPYDGTLIANGAEQDFRLQNGILQLKIKLASNSAKRVDATGVLRLDHAGDGAVVGYEFAAPIVADPGTAR